MADVDEWFKLIALLVAIPIAFVLIGIVAAYAMSAGSLAGQILRILAVEFAVVGLVFASVFAANKLGLIGRNGPLGLLEFDSRYVRRVNSSGQILLEVDTDRQFEWRYLDHENGYARYRLYQGDRRLEFDSDEAAARQIVTGILGREWPPMRKIRLHYSG